MSSSDSSCEFAVKSGGHGLNRNQSNVQDGVTIDLAKFKHVRIAEDQQNAELGPGLLWGEAYRALEEKGLRVVGGRVSTVGVGGLLMGGGISFLSGRHGWACDNILSFEIVLPNTTVATVSAENDPDLFWALHGGGNNFGIVTSFKLRTYPANPTWLHQMALPWSDVPTMISLAESFAYNNTDPDALAYWAYGYIADWGLHLGCIAMAHTNHSTKKPWPQAYRNEQKLLNPLMFSSTTVLGPMSEITALIDKGNPPGFRNIYRSMAIISSAEVEAEMVSAFHQIVKDMQIHFQNGQSKSSILAKSPREPVFEPFIVIQPIPLKTVMHTMSSGAASPMSNGPDTPFPFNLPPSTQPLTLISVAWKWSIPPISPRPLLFLPYHFSLNPPFLHPLPPPKPPSFSTQQTYDTYHRSTVTRLFHQLESIAKRHAKFHPFIYPNYAAEGQNVYGKETNGIAGYEKLQRVQERVDPGGKIFGKHGLCAGGNKIWRSRSRSDDDDKTDTVVNEDDKQKSVIDGSEIENDRKRIMDVDMEEEDDDDDDDKLRINHENTHAHAHDNANANANDIDEDNNTVKSSRDEL